MDITGWNRGSVGAISGPGGQEDIFGYLNGYLRVHVPDCGLAVFCYIGTNQPIVWTLIKNYCLLIWLRR